MENASAKSKPPLATLQTADVAFDGERCVSRRFGDIYFSADGPDEVRRVFLAPAAVAERAQASDQRFTITELGFGTGLNLVVAAGATRACISCRSNATRCHAPTWRARSAPGGTTTRSSTR